MSEKTCCVTGHRDIPADKVDFIRARLREEIKTAIADGYTSFLSGFAQGADLLFAELVVEQMEEHPHLFLEAAIPYRNRLKSKDALFQKCLAACKGIRVEQEEYSRDALMNRNRNMVSMSSRVIAVYDGRDKGGTLFTMRCAHTHQKEVREIRI